jgi:hypothetical protein
MLPLKYFGNNDSLKCSLKLLRASIIGWLPPLYPVAYSFGCSRLASLVQYRLFLRKPWSAIKIVWHVVDQPVATIYALVRHWPLENTNHELVGSNLRRQISEITLGSLRLSLVSTGIQLLRACRMITRQNMYKFSQLDMATSSKTYDLAFPWHMYLIRSHGPVNCR